MKTIRFINGTNVKYSFFTNQGVLTIVAGVAATIGVLLLEKKAYFEGLEDAKEVIGID